MHRRMGSSSLYNCCIILRESRQKFVMVLSACLLISFLFPLTNFCLEFFLENLYTFRRERCTSVFSLEGLNRTAKKDFFCQNLISNEVGWSINRALPSLMRLEVKSEKLLLWHSYDILIFSQIDEYSRHNFPKPCHTSWLSSRQVFTALCSWLSSENVTLNIFLEN